MITLIGKIKLYKIIFSVTDSSLICKVPVTINESMTAPVNIYYYLTNFFLNQRDLARSRSFQQLRNVDDKSNYTRCKGALLVKEIFDFNSNRYVNPWNYTLNPDSIANPCGLAAKTFFNGINMKMTNIILLIIFFNFSDSYTFTDSNNSVITIDETNISDDYFKQYMFKRNDNYTSSQWIDVQNEHFINWMQTESFPNFIKLYGRINKNLEPGTYYFNVINSKK